MRSMEGLPQTILTPRLTLRPVQAEDRSVIEAGLRESWPEVQRWVVWASIDPEGVEAEGFARGCNLENQIEKFKAGRAIFTKACERESGEFISAATLYNADWDKMSIEAGYWTRTSKTGQGFTTEAMAALLLYGFNVLGMQTITADHVGDHAASRKVLLNLGFHMDCVEKDSVVMGDGRVLDKYLYSLTDRNRLPPIDAIWK